MKASQLQGLIPILFGTYAWLLAYGIVPRNPKDPEKMALWHRKFGPMMKVLAPLIILFGILQLLGVFG